MSFNWSIYSMKNTDDIIKRLTKHVYFLIGILLEILVFPTGICLGVLLYQFLKSNGIITW
jgi:hypothetical protein